ncbi:MAG: hypothetical protein HYW51_03805 [Candidatus Doudnabacteria bacterium]|nr:hypothetical protein [Candidatus Doudnabacteria bacterium]
MRPSITISFDFPPEVFAPARGWPAFGWDPLLADNKHSFVNSLWIPVVQINDKDRPCPEPETLVTDFGPVSS